MTTTPPMTRTATSIQPAIGTRLDSLTGLRGLAALGIFLAHLNVFLPIPHTKVWFDLGGVGVPYFFILSGFVVTWSFFDGDTARRFYARRFARIWPVLFASTVVAVALAFWFARGTNRGETLWLGAASLLVIHGWFQSGILNSPNPVAWPVSAEAFYYAVFPWIVRPALRRTLRQLAVLAVGLVLFGWAVKTTLWILYPAGKQPTASGIRNLVLGTMSPPARINEFLLGIVLAVAIRKGWRSPLRPIPVLVMLAGALGVLVLYQDAPWRQATIYDALDPVGAPLIALLIAALATHELEGRRSWLKSRPMVLLGNWSYAFFLFQFLVLFVVGSLALHMHALVDFYYQPIQPRWVNLGWAGLALLITVALCAVLHHFYEAPLDRKLRGLLRARRT